MSLFNETGDGRFWIDAGAWTYFLSYKERSALYRAGDVRWSGMGDPRRPCVILPDSPALQRIMAERLMDAMAGEPEPVKWYVTDIDTERGVVTFGNKPPAKQT